MEQDFFSRVNFSLVTLCNSELCLPLPLLPRHSGPAGLCCAKGFLPGASLLEVDAGAGILLDQRRRQCLNLTVGDGVFSTCILVGVFIGFKLWSSLLGIFRLQSSRRLLGGCRALKGL